MDNKFLEFIVNIIKNEKFYGPILTILIGYLFYKIIVSGIHKMLLRKNTSGYEAKRRRTVLELINNVIKYFLIIICSLIILNIFDVNTTSIVASLGVASAVLGLAFQDTIKDFIGGITIILENYFIVGDYIKYKDFTGDVVSFGFRTTKIRNFNNEILTIANRNISEIVNLSQSKAAVLIHIPAAYEETTENVEKSIKTILKKLEKNEMIIKGTTTYLGVSDLGESSVT